MRFYFKEKESINAKILKDVKFPMEFDAFDLCTPKLQEKLSDARSKFKVDLDFSCIDYYIHFCFQGVGRCPNRCCEG